MAHRLLQQTKPMYTAILRGLLMGKRRYKRDFENNVQKEPTFKGAGYVFVDHPEQGATVLDAVEKMASCLYKKLEGRTY